MSAAAGNTASPQVLQPSQEEELILAHTKDCLNCLVARCNNQVSAFMLPECNHQKKININDGYQEARQLFFRLHKAQLSFVCSLMFAPMEAPQLRAQRLAENPKIGHYPGLATVMNRIEDLLPQGRVTTRWWNRSDAGKLEPESTGHFQYHQLGEIGPGCRYVKRGDPNGKQYLSSRSEDNE